MLACRLLCVHALNTYFPVSRYFRALGKKMRISFVVTLILLSLALLVVHVEAAMAAIANTTMCTAIIYGVPTCPHCRATKAALEKLGLNLTFIDVSSVGRRAFAEMVKRYVLRLTTAVGVPLTYVRCGNHTMLVEGEVIIPGVSVADEYKLWAKLIDALKTGEMRSIINTTVKFRSVVCLSTPDCSRVARILAEELVKRNQTGIAAKVGCLAGLALCLASNETIVPILPSSATPTRQTSKTGNKTVTGRHSPTTLNETVKGSASSLSLAPLFVSLVSLALLDAINPCFLTLYALTIAAVASIKGRLAALKTGLGVALGVFTGYYMLGLGLVQAAASIPWVRYALAAAAMGVGLVATLKKLGVIKLEEESCLVCRLASRLGIGGASMTPFLGYVFGLIASLTLLPCSAGPYLIASVYLSHFPLLLQLLGLLVYNLVFISPIVAMAVAASVVAAYEAVRRILEPLSGPILIILGLYILFEPNIELLLGLAAGR